MVEAQHPKTALGSHNVTNQAEGFEGVSLYESDPRLAAWLRGRTDEAQREQIEAFGQTLGRHESWQLAEQANRFPPELATFDRAGRRLDEVRYHPAYHELMRLGCEAGVASLAWRSGSGGHQAHAALEYMLIQVEPGVCCPLTMSYAGAPVLAQSPELASFHERLITPSYDASSRPWHDKRAVTLGMAMTEKQGGSDLRQTQTRAERCADGYRLTGHKWFCSAPMSDAFLMLAQAPEGLSCFWVPRWQPDGQRNGIELQRLKDKLGNRANASSEIELQRAYGVLIGEPGRGIATILEMVHHTRLDCAVAAAGLMRQAVVRAIHHARQRRAFGKALIEHDLMARVLAAIDLEAEAATLLSLRAAELCDAGPSPLARLGVAIAKYWNNKRCPLVVAEAMEALGGAGYIEASVMPRLYKEAPLNGIWEGSGNVICLDILRTTRRLPEVVDALRHELGAQGESVLEWLPSAQPADARALAGQLARAWQRSLLERHSVPGAAQHLSSAVGAFGECFPVAGAGARLRASLPEL